jgi:hypothetical protein
MFVNRNIVRVLSLFQSTQATNPLLEKQKALNLVHMDNPIRPFIVVGQGCPTYEESLTCASVGGVHPEGIHPEGLPAPQRQLA